MTSTQPAIGRATAASGDATRLRALRDLVQSVASGSGLRVALDHIARWVEQASPASLCSILLLDEDGLLVRNGAAPSLPPEFCASIDGLAIGPRAGSCGTAAYTGKPVIVDDIATDPLWDDYREYALPFGLRACWSHPIIGVQERVIGTFAVYHRTTRRPTPEEWELVIDAAGLSALVIDRARADTKRLEQEQTLASILQHASDQIVRFAADGGIAWFNASARRIFSEMGVLAGDAGGVDIEAMPSAVRDAWLAARESVLASGNEYRFEFDVALPSGLRSFDALLSPEFDANGVITSFVAVARDLTERKHLERELRVRDARLRMVLNSTQQWIALLDREGRIIDVGERVENVVGGGRERVLGTHFWETEPFADLPDSQAALRGAIARGAAGETTSGEVPWRNQARALLLGAYTVTPIRGADGDVSQLLLEGSDITEKRELESRVRQAEKMESLGRLAGGIAHDFNNVLAAIQGYGELVAADAAPSSEISTHIGELLGAARRARDLVRQILAFSRKGDLEYVSIDLRAVVGEGVRLLRAGLPSTVALWERVPDRPVVIRGDAGQISQVLLNLGANAEYAMRRVSDGAIDIILERTALDSSLANALGVSPGAYARLVVRDSGSGIAPEVVPKIFEPFFTTKPVGEGTGMGLAVVHGIVTAHGGAVRVESAPGEGTTFTVYLPTVGTPARIDAVRPAAIATGSGNVLIVDDEVSIVTMLGRLLPRRGYGATGVTTPEEAYERFRAQPSAFDLLITDRTMPGMTGDELVERVHAIRPELPVVICSGQGHGDGQVAALGRPHVQQVAKPFELSDLLRAMERAREAVRDGRWQGAGRGGTPAAEGEGRADGASGA